MSCGVSVFASTPVCLRRSNLTGLKSWFIFIAGYWFVSRGQMRRTCCPWCLDSRLGKRTQMHHNTPQFTAVVHDVLFTDIKRTLNPVQLWWPSQNRRNYFFPVVLQLIIQALAVQTNSGNIIIIPINDLPAHWQPRWRTSACMKPMKYGSEHTALL